MTFFLVVVVVVVVDNCIRMRLICNLKAVASISIFLLNMLIRLNLLKKKKKLNFYF